MEIKKADKNTKSNNMKILITGGHITPALALIEELQKHENIEIIFVGRQFANKNEKIINFFCDPILQ